MSMTTGSVVSGSISVEAAPLIPSTLRANSTTAHCSPRQIPRNGRLLILEYAYRGYRSIKDLYHAEIHCELL